MDSLDDLPAPFLAFLAQNHITTKEYEALESSPLPRYIRVHPSHLTTLTQPTLSVALGTPALQPVPWLPSGFYSLPSTVSIASSEPYRAGHIYGIDVASVVAVLALQVDRDDHVLDLCCAPGTKLCFLADHQRDGRGTVTGVDVNASRMATCRSVTKKYKLERCRLFVQDGTTFRVHAPSRIGGCPVTPLEEDDDDALESFPRTRVKPFHATRLLRDDRQLVHDRLLYDKVLVDAECTHDGSIAHLIKYVRTGWETFETNVLDPHRLKGLETLQRGLLENGFRMCRKGGILVYSTCSFSHLQNEDVVAWFLKRHGGEAVLERIPGVEAYPVAEKVLPSEGFRDVRLDHVIRFSPMASRTSGLFIARIRRIG
ncbi:hypothetical protein HKX48_000502 [Thoreauomyces humboldtii]|nr:hypothetical protein HKX48_000502 [Thoreauomyces humboldtii]